jgi:CubicO group peptidase (beta-lactamase class C family)
MILLPFLLCLSPTVGQGQVPTGRTLPGVPDSPFPCATPEESGLSSEALDALAAGVRQWVEEGDVVGAEFLLMKDRRIVLHQAVGWRDKEKGLPLERNSIYRIRSMTKPFTATAVFILMEEGRLSLEDRVARYPPSWQNDSSRDITIRQLLSHTGGFVQGGGHGRSGATGA